MIFSHFLVHVLPQAGRSNRDWRLARRRPAGDTTGRKETRTCVLIVVRGWILTDFRVGWRGPAPRRADHHSARSTVDADPLTSLPIHWAPCPGLLRKPWSPLLWTLTARTLEAAHWWTWDLFSIHSPCVSIQTPKQATLAHRKEAYILGIRNFILYASQCLCVRDKSSRSKDAAVAVTEQSSCAQ